MPRDYKAYLDDIMQSVEKINQYVSGFSFKSFCDDDKTVDAILRNLEIIGEANIFLKGSVPDIQILNGKG